MEWVIGVVQRLQAELEVAEARAKVLGDEYQKAHAVSYAADREVEDLKEAIKSMEQLLPGVVREEPPL